MPDADMGKGAIGDNHAVAAHKAENAGVKLIGAAAVVAVQQDNLGAVSKGVIVDVVKALEANDVLLEALTLGDVHALLKRLHGCPTVGAHGFDNLAGWEKGITVADAWLCLPGEDRGRGAAESVVVEDFKIAILEADLIAAGRS